MLLEKKGDWIKIGASVRNIKPNTMEDYINMLLFTGGMNGQMGASWISALLVRSNVGVIF